MLLRAAHHTAESSIGQLEGRPLWEALARFDRQTFTAFCDVFVIEIGCPRCSLNLRAPGELEQHLLTLLEHGIGIGAFPEHLAYSGRRCRQPALRAAGPSV